MSVKYKIKILPEYAILAGIILFFITTNVIWLALDETPPSWDDSYHMKTCLLYGKLIPRINTSGALKEIFSLSDKYPPFFYVLSLPILYFFGFKEDYLVLVNSFYLIVFVLSIFGIGKKLFNTRVGILSALLTLLYPIMFGLSRRYLLDFALVAIVTAVQYMLLRYADEDKKRSGFLLFALVAMAVLIKQTAVIFLTPVMLLVFCSKWGKDKSVWVALLLLFIPLILIVLRYWNNIAYQLSYDTGIHKAWNIFCAHILLYIKFLRPYLIGHILLLFFLAGLALFMIFNRRWKVLLILTGWTVPAFFILPLMRWYWDPRYLMPVLPAFGLITIGGIDALKKKFIKVILTASVIAVGFIQFFNLSFNLHPVLFKQSDFHFNRSPLRQDWKVKEILEYIRHRFGNKNVTIGLFPDCEYFNPGTFALYITSNDLPYSTEALFWYKDAFGKNIGHCDVVVTKIPFSSDYCRDGRSAKSYEGQIASMLKEHNFKDVKNFPLPDNSKAMIYQR